MTDGPSYFDWAPDLEGAQRDEVDGWSELSAAERAEIERLDLEVCGLLASTLEPVEPSPHVEQAILDGAAGAEAREPVTARPEPPEPTASVAGFPAPSPARRRRWLLPLAATLAVVAVALAAGLYDTVLDQRSELAELESRVRALAADAAELAAIQDGLARAQENLQLVSSQGVEVCPLRPMEGDLTDDSPYGLLFLAADHQHWYVRVSGLEPAPDRYYRLWFEGPDGTMIPAGNLRGAELELSSPSMPEGTRAVYVSVETVEAPAEPSGEIVLGGDEMIRVL